MKKAITLLLALVLVLSMSIPALAAESGDIKVTYSQPDPARVTYVDLTWGSMEFNYNSGDTKVWNPEKLEYEIVPGKAEDASWTPVNEGGDTVTVTNHSNTGLLVTVVYTPAEENGVSGTLENSSFLLATAEGTDKNNAPKGSAKLTLDPASRPASWSTEGATTIGNITVKLDHCDVQVSTFEELEAALENGGTIMLMADITLTDSLDVYNNTVIYLNGHTVTTDNDGFDVWNGATLTVSGEGTMTGDEYYGPIQVWGGTVNLLGCTVDGNVFVDEEGGTVHLSGGYVKVLGGTGEIVVSDGQVATLLITNAAVTVTGGTVSVIDMEWCENGTLTITGGTFGFDPTAYLAEGYTATEADGIWTVTAN